MTTSTIETIQALIDALKTTNRAIEPFITESPDLCVQFEDNEDLIQMVEPDVEAEKEMSCDVLICNDMVIGANHTPGVDDIKCKRLIVSNKPNVK